MNIINKQLLYNTRCKKCGVQIKPGIRRSYGAKKFICGDCFAVYASRYSTLEIELPISSDEWESIRAEYEKILFWARGVTVDWLGKWQ